MTTFGAQGGPSLKARAIAGAKSTTASSVAVTAIQFLQLTVVARLLSPADFGLMAMVMAVLGFAQIFTDMGVGSAIIHRKENSPNELSSLFWLNASGGTVVFLLMIAGDTADRCLLRRTKACVAASDHGGAFPDFLQRTAISASPAEGTAVRDASP